MYTMYVYAYNGVCALTHSELFETPWTVAHQAPLFIGSSRQEYWNGLPLPSQRIFLTQGLNPGLLHCRQILYYLSHHGGVLSFPAGSDGEESPCSADRKSVV